jgi:hypothetical protein
MDVPQFSLPLRLQGTGFALAEQGSSDELADRVNVLVRTPPGWLDGRPGFGLADQAFRKTGADLAEVGRQIDVWVPDAATVLEHDPSGLDKALDFLGIQVSA